MSSLDFNSLNDDTRGQLACTLAALILADSKKSQTSEEISNILKTAKVNVPEYWPILFQSALADKNINDLLSGSGSTSTAPAQATGPAKASEKKDEPKKEAKVEKVKEPEPEVEVDMDMGDLFG